jgi:hypothetical protein
MNVQRALPNSLNDAAQAQTQWSDEECNAVMST